MPKPTLSSGTASPVSRRYFIKYTTLAVATLGTSPAFLRGQNLHNHITVAVVGAAGKGAGDTVHSPPDAGDILASCDVDMNPLSGLVSRTPSLAFVPGV